MDSFGGFGATREVEVDLMTDSYRISGIVETRFGRATDILNQQNSTHLAVSQATISEHADPTATASAPSALVAVSSILLLAAPNLTGAASAEMRIQKRPVRVELALPPLRVAGVMHIAPGSRPADGLLNMTDPFLTMTDATVTSAAHPALAHSAPAIAVRRDRAQVLLITDDEQADELLADVLDERTAEAWLRPGDAQG
jgi:hypothetical protein